jgi:hypothetical protein
MPVLARPDERWRAEVGAPIDVGAAINEQAGAFYRPKPGGVVEGCLVVLIALVNGHTVVEEGAEDLGMFGLGSPVKW